MIGTGNSLTDTDRANLEAALIMRDGHAAPEQVRLVSSPLLAALRRTGTGHVYADTADREELRRVLAVPGGGILAEVDGNTVNQPLARQVLDRYLEGDRLATCAQELHPSSGGDRCRPSSADLHDGIGLDRGRPRGRVRRRPRVGGESQLHMEALSDPETAKSLGRALRAIIPSCFVKVLFRPHEPQSLLIARDLEAEGIPVNFRRLAADTHMSLLADGDFVNQQEAIAAALLRRAFGRAERRS